MTDTMTVMSSEAPIMKEKQSKKKKETAKERKLREQNAAAWEGGHDNDVRAYRHERPARVGGLNTASDAAFHGMNVVIPVDGMSSTELYAEQYVAWHMTHSPAVAPKTTLTSLELLKF